MGAHDLFFGQLFQHRENAMDVLRWSVPPDLSDHLDWTTLTFERTSSRQRRPRHADLICAVQTRAGPAMRLDFLFEHQRHAERDMPLRIAEYLAHAWLRQQQAGVDLCRIVPVVLYNGSRPWNRPTSVEALMPGDGLEALMGDLQLRSRFLLVDLHAVPDASIQAAALGAHVKLGLLLLKNAPTMPAPRFWSHFGDWTQWLAQIVTMPDGMSRLLSLLEYIAHVVGSPSEENLENIMSELPESAVERVVTWAEALRQAGVERGREEGIEKGIEKGREEGRKLEAQRLLRTLLEQRFGPLTEPLSQAIDHATIEQLERWMKRMLDASTAEEVVDR
jgi:predicted transposase YdaD